jgi:hypothetical protein
MDRQRVIQEWVEATEKAIGELQAWLGTLQEWDVVEDEREACEFALVPPRPRFEEAFDRLCKAGLGDTWADVCPAGGGLDRLAKAVSGDR